MSNAELAKDLKFWNHTIRSTKAAPRTEARARNNIKMMKNKTPTMLQTGRIEFTVLDFLILNSFWPRFVSVRGAAFDIRISDLLRRGASTVNLLKSFCLTFQR